MECQDCGEETEEFFQVRVEGRNLKLCEDCADVRREQAEIAEEAEGVMQGMMEYKGR